RLGFKSMPARWGVRGGRVAFASDLHGGNEAAERVPFDWQKIRLSACPRLTLWRTTALRDAAVTNCAGPRNFPTHFDNRSRCGSETRGPQERVSARLFSPELAVHPPALH